MSELKVEIPEDLKLGAMELGKEELNRIVRKALSERLMFKIADELLKESKFTDELALKLGDELKERVANRHDL